MYRLASEWSPAQSKMDFSIDASYEFSKVLLNLGVKLTHTKLICVKKVDRCAIWVQKASFNEVLYFFSLLNKDFL